MQFRMVPDSTRLGMGLGSTLLRTRLLLAAKKNVNLQCNHNSYTDSIQLQPEMKITDGVGRVERKKEKEAQPGLMMGQVFAKLKTGKRICNKSTNKSFCWTTGKRRMDAEHVTSSASPFPWEKTLD